jgi:hypothetical protein
MQLLFWQTELFFAIHDIMDVFILIILISTNAEWKIKIRA